MNAAAPDEWDLPDIDYREDTHNIDHLRRMVTSCLLGDVITCCGRGGKPVTLNRDWNKVPYVVIVGLRQWSTGVDVYRHTADVDVSTLTKEGPFWVAWFMSL